MQLLTKNFCNSLQIHVQSPIKTFNNRLLSAFATKKPTRFLLIGFIYHIITFCEKWLTPFSLQGIQMCPHKFRSHNALFDCGLPKLWCGACLLYTIGCPCVHTSRQPEHCAPTSLCCAIRSYLALAFPKLLYIPSRWSQVRMSLRPALFQGSAHRDPFKHCLSVLLYLPTYFLHN